MAPVFPAEETTPHCCGFPEVPVHGSTCLSFRKASLQFHHQSTSLTLSSTCIRFGAILTKPSGNSHRTCLAPPDFPKRVLTPQEKKRFSFQYLRRFNHSSNSSKEAAGGPSTCDFCSITLHSRTMVNTAASLIVHRVQMCTCIQFSLQLEETTFLVLALSSPVRMSGPAHKPSREKWLRVKKKQMQINKLGLSEGDSATSRCVHVFISRCHLSPVSTRKVSGGSPTCSVAAHKYSSPLKFNSTTGTTEGSLTREENNFGWKNRNNSHSCDSQQKTHRHLPVHSQARVHVYSIHHLVRS